MFTSLPGPAILRVMTDPTYPGDQRPSATRTVALSVGCEFELHTVQPVPAVLQIAPRQQSGVQFHREQWDTSSDHHGYIDLYDNPCERFTIDAGHSRIAYAAELLLTDPADVIKPDARETPVSSVPDEAVSFIMPSRFCLPDELGHQAWQLFGDVAPGWGRVQSVVDYVHGHLKFVPGTSNPWTTAADAYRAGQGVCRDFAHLAITFCRALNIPARYVFGYIPDIDVPAPDEPMDFAAWFEVYLDGRWYAFDARNNTPRVGRVVVGRGRDAIDVALITSFGPVTLTGFQVRADEITPSSG
jgi:transglutaminase-like putative cysteine protease